MHRGVGVKPAVRLLPGEGEGRGRSLELQEEYPKVGVYKVRRCEGVILHVLRAEVRQAALQADPPGGEWGGGWSGWHKLLSWPEGARTGLHKNYKILVQDWP